MARLLSPSTGVRQNREAAERNFRRLLDRSTRTLILALGLPLLALLGLVLFMIHSAHLVDQTDDLVVRALQAENLLITMQNGVRGYRFDRDPTFLEPYEKARKKVLPQLEGLEDKVRENPSQQERLISIRKSVAGWMTTVADYLTVMKEQGWPPKEETLRTARRLMNDSLKKLEVFRDVQKDRRVARAEQLHLVILGVFSLIGMAALVGVPLLISFIKSLFRQANHAYRESLAATEQRAAELYVTLSSIGDAVVVTDVEGKVDFLNPVAEKLMGWSLSEARRRPLSEVFSIFNEETGEVVASPVERVLREKVVVGLTNHTVVRSRQGQEVPIEDSAAPIQDEEGKVLGVVLVFHDVTLKKEAARKTAEMQRRIVFLGELGEATRTLLDVESIMRVATRLLGKHLRASRCAYAEVDPTTDDFVIPQDYTDGCASTAGNYQLGLFGTRAATDMHAGRMLVIENVDEELSQSDGAEMFNLIGIKALICCPLLKGGELRAMMAVHQTRPRKWTAGEISLVEEVVERCWATIERARAEVESKEREERIRLLSEVVSLQVWTADLAGDLDYVNQQCMEYFGTTSPGEVLGKNWARFVHPADLEQAVQTWTVSIASGERYEAQFRLLSGAGEYRWFIVRAETMRHANGQAYRWFGTNTDIHELKMAQSRAEEANQAKDGFIAALSHELRTPLNPVLMATAELNSDERLPGDLRELVEMIERNVALEARLIDDLLDVTSIAQGKLHLHCEPCDAHNLIQLALNIVHQDAIAKGVALGYEALAKHARMEADPTRFQQVIWNLLRNAVKFTPEGGSVMVRTVNDREGQLRIEVTDSGMGIEADLLEKIFKPFEQGGLVGNHRFGGVGLGLAIARAITEAHGGSITATSPGADCGATFLVKMPIL